METYLWFSEICNSLHYIIIYILQCPNFLGIEVVDATVSMWFILGLTSGIVLWIKDGVNCTDLAV